MGLERAVKELESFGKNAELVLETIRSYGQTDEYILAHSIDLGIHYLADRKLMEKSASEISVACGPAGESKLLFRSRSGKELESASVLSKRFEEQYRADTFIGHFCAYSQFEPDIPLTLLPYGDVVMYLETGCCRQFFIEGLVAGRDAFTMHSFLAASDQSFEAYREKQVERQIREFTEYVARTKLGLMPDDSGTKRLHTILLFPENRLDAERAGE